MLPLPATYTDCNRNLPHASRRSPPAGSWTGGRTGLLLWHAARHERRKAAKRMQFMTGSSSGTCNCTQCLSRRSQQGVADPNGVEFESSRCRFTRFSIFENYENSRAQNEKYKIYRKARKRERGGEGKVNRKQSVREHVLNQLGRMSRCLLPLCLLPVPAVRVHLPH